MNIKNLTLSTCIAFAGFQVTAQDLSSKIPAQAKLILSINNKALVENSSPELLSDALTKLEAFKNTDTDIKAIIQSDFDLSKQAYFYYTNTDSIQYVGFLAPLKENHRVKDHLFSDYNILPTTKSYERRVSKNGEIQVAWNQESLLILTGDLIDNYFQTKEMSAHYGLEFASNNTNDWEYNEDLAVAADSEWAVEEPSATYDTVYVEESVEEPISAAEVEEAWETYEAPDVETVATAAAAVADAAAATYELEYPEMTQTEDVSEAYEDEWNWYSHLLSPEQEAKNDSIKNVLFTHWIENDFDSYLDPKNNLGNNKFIKLHDTNHLIRVWIPDFDQLYKDILPSEILSLVYNFDMKNLKYGYKDATFDLIQENHNLRFTTNVNTDDDLAKYLKAISKNKVNKKFAHYIPENYIAYSSLNISTEAYLKELPKFITRWYMPAVEDDFFEIVATALEITLDEKAIGKVIKGDNLLFVNDLKKVTREYVTYDYDEDYNYEEVKETKEEYVPDYLWMFTSEDQRLFKKILEYSAVKEKIAFENGIYRTLDEDNSEPIHILFKDNIVFVGSNLEQISAISENRFSNRKDAKVKKDILSNPFNLRIKTAAIPEITNKLEVPVSLTNNDFLENLSGYGDIQVKINKMKKNTIHSEISIELPKKDKNALQYILKNLIENLNTNSINEL